MTTHKPLTLAIATAPDADTARRLGSRLVEQRLAACVNLIPGVQSIYRWQEAIESDTEVVMLIKTHPGAVAAINAVLRNEHPYDVPELITLPIDDGLPDYLAWVAESTNA